MNKWLEKYRKSIWFLMILLVALLAIAYFFLLRPLITELVSKQQNLSALEAEAGSLQGKLAELQPDKLTAATIEKLLKGVPNSPNIQHLIANIEQVEQATGVLVDSVSFTLQDAQPLEERFPEQIVGQLTKDEQELKVINLAAVTMQINFHGTEENIQRFITKIQDTPRIIHVTSISFTEEEESFYASLSLTAYYSTDFTPFLPEMGVEFDSNNSVELATDVEPAESSSLENGPTVTDLDPVLVPELNSRFPIYVQQDLSASRGISAQRFYLLQVGAYSSDRILELNINKLSKLGIQPRVYGEKLKIIYAGVAGDYATARKKDSFIQESGFNTFIHPLDYNHEMLNEELIQAADYVLEQLAQHTASAYSTTKQNITRELLLQLKQDADEFQQLVTKFLEKEGDLEKKARMNAALAYLNMVLQEIEAYSDTEAVENLWAAEGYLLDFVLILSS